MAFSKKAGRSSARKSPWVKTISNGNLDSETALKLTLIDSLITVVVKNNKTKVHQIGLASDETLTRPLGRHELGDEHARFRGKLFRITANEQLRDTP